MTAILNYLSSLFESFFTSFQSIIQFFISTIKGVASFFRLLPTFITYITGSIGALPSFLAMFAVVIIAIAVLHIVLEVI